MHFRSPSRISSLEGEERRRTWKQSFTPGFGSFNKDLTSETGWESLTCSIRSESSGPASIKSCLKVATQEESLLQRHIPAPKETLLEPKTVSFGCVTVNAHERMLGDNPAVRYVIKQPWNSTAFSLVSPVALPLDALSHSPVAELPSRYHGSSSVPSRLPSMTTSKINLPPSTATWLSLARSASGGWPTLAIEEVRSWSPEDKPGKSGSVGRIALERLIRNLCI